MLSFDPLFADRYQLQVLASVRSDAGLGLAETYTTNFTAIGDLTSVLGLHFSGRAERSR